MACMLLALTFNTVHGRRVLLLASSVEVHSTLGSMPFCFPRSDFAIE